MKHILCTTIAFLILTSCEKDAETFKTIDLEQFKIEVPADWEHEVLRGIDSKVGELSNGKISLYYDYGWHSNDFSNLNFDMHTRTNITIGGKPALLAKPLEKGNGILGVYIEVDDMNRLNIYGENIEDEEMILKIFHSIQFQPE